MKLRTCCREAAQWIAPGVGLVLIPKCPMCVAAYVAAITGLGVSMPVAAGIRLGLMTVCITALAFVATRTTVRLARSRRNNGVPARCECCSA
jgi:hypothetical protein